MFAKVMCPACQHKFSIPEGDMGKRQICPNCQSPFVAGKFVPDGEAPRLQPAAAPAPAPAAGVNKTMLGETGPAIKYNCPRCKKALESPSIEAGTKKACPECGQRLQVPAAPPSTAPAAAPNLNKTILASEENFKASPAAGTNKTMLVSDDPPLYYNCPRCKKPLESPSIEAGTKKPCPECGQRLQVPSASTRKPNQTMLGEAEATRAPSAATVPSSQATAGAPAVSNRMLGMAGLGLGALIFLVLLACVVPAVIRGGKSEDSAALAQAKKELEALKAQIEQTKQQMDKQKQFEDEQKSKWDKMLAEQKTRQDRVQYEWELNQKNEEYRNNQELMAAAKARYDKQQRKLDDERREAVEKQRLADAQVKAQIEALQAQIKSANERQQVIIHQPAPYIHYSPFHPRYYSPWGW